MLSIKAAPEECSCSKCLVSLVTSECGFRSRDIYGFRRLSGCSLIMNVKKKLSSQNGPEYPDQSDKVNRLNSLRELYEFEEAEDIAEAGFFSGSKILLLKVLVKCKEKSVTRMSINPSI